MSDALVRRLLVPLDGSERAEIAVGYAAMLARRLGAGVVLLRVAPDRGGAEEARRYLEGAARALGLPIETEVRVGDAAHEILGAEREGDLVVMASHGATGLERFWLGGVADRIVRYGRAPVVVLRALGAPPKSPSPILVPLDGSALAEAALPYAETLARVLDAAVRLLRVVHTRLFDAIAYPPEIVEMTLEWERQEGTRYLSEIVSRLEGQGLRAFGELRDGEPSEAIADAARSHDAGLIVMTTRGRSGLSRSALGSVAARVTERAPVPVLLVRA